MAWWWLIRLPGGGEEYSEEGSSELWGAGVSVDTRVHSVLVIIDHPLFRFIVQEAHDWEALRLHLPDFERSNRCRSGPGSAAACGLQPGTAGEAV